jgi:phage terminase small subunit
MPKGSVSLTSRQLTQKQENFCLLFVESGHAADSFREAYGSEGNRATCMREAHRLLQNPRVRQRIEELRAAASERAEISVADVIRELWDNAMKSKQAVAVRDKDGNETGEWQANFAASNQALKLVGDNLGAFERKPQAEQESLLSKLTPDERRALRAALEQERDRRAALAAAGPDVVVGDSAPRTLN